MWFCEVGGRRKVEREDGRNEERGKEKERGCAYIMLIQSHSSLPPSSPPSSLAVQSRDTQWHCSHISLKHPSHLAVLLCLDRTDMCACVYVWVNGEALQLHAVYKKPLLPQYKAILEKILRQFSFVLWWLGRAWPSPTLLSSIAIFHIFSVVSRSVYFWRCNFTW